MGCGEAWGGGPAHLSSRLQASARARKAEEAILGTADWRGSSCMLGSSSQAHTGCMLTGVSRLGQIVGFLEQQLV